MPYDQTSLLCVYFCFFRKKKQRELFLEEIKNRKLLWIRALRARSISFDTWFSRWWFRFLCLWFRLILRDQNPRFSLYYHRQWAHCSSLYLDEQYGFVPNKSNLRKYHWNNNIFRVFSYQSTLTKQKKTNLFER